MVLHISLELLEELLTDDAVHLLKLKDLRVGRLILQKQVLQCQKKWFRPPCKGSCQQLNQNYLHQMYQYGLISTFELKTDVNRDSNFVTNCSGMM